MKWNVAAFSTHLNSLIARKNTGWVKWVWSHRIGRSSFWSLPIPQTCSWTWRKLLGLRDTLLPLIVHRMAISSEVNFWFDPWVDNGVILHKLFNYHQANQTGIPKTAKAVEYISQGELLLPYSSNQYIRSVWNEIQRKTYPPVEVDVVHWSAKPHSVSHVYNLLNHSSSIQAFKWSKIIWSTDSASKDNLMLWKVVQNALLTKSKMMEMGIDFGFSCVFCSNFPKTTHHLFFECSYNLILLRKMMQLAGSKLLSNLRPIDLDMIYKATRWRTLKARCLTFCLKKYMNIVWVERNMIRFEKKRRDGEALWKILKHEIYIAMMALPIFPAALLDAWR